MTQEEIVAAVYAAWEKSPSFRDSPSPEEATRRRRVFDDECECLCERLRLEEGHDLFEALFPMACAEYDPFHTPTVFAGHLLLYLVPPCPLSCQEAVRAVIVTLWDPSLEEVPWYLAEYFGASEVSEVIEALNGESYILEARAKRKAWYEAWYAALPTPRDAIKNPPVPWDVSASLETVEFWLSIYVDNANKGRTWEPLWR